MSATYQPILWNKQKKIYDGIMLGLIALYLLLFVIFNTLFHPDVTVETIIIRGTGSLALLMLHIILMIGPMTRLDKRFLPLLYNRRHLGVTMFIIALIHGIFSIMQFHSLGDTGLITSIFSANISYTTLPNFPFQTLGFFALLILFLMAATSHDFWLANLSAKVWKTLHMMVYLAYALLIMHVMLGTVQLEHAPTSVLFLGIGMFVVISLHLITGWKQAKAGKLEKIMEKDGYIKACTLKEIENNRAKLIEINGESIAIYKYENKLSAVNNFCQHQNGPLSEGKIIDGCITCPWHGYQYLPHNGSSPPPFTEKISTYHLKVEGDTIWVNPKPEAEGTAIEPVVF